MKLIKKSLKIIGISTFTFILFVLIYLLSAYCLSRITVNENIVENEDVEIYILTNGVHTDLVFPIRNHLKDWSKDIKFSNTNSQDTTMNFVAFGWGDKGFYLETPTWSDLKLSVAFKAAFALSSSAMHTTFYKNIQEGSSCKKIKIGSENYQKIVDYVASSFQKDNSGEYINIKTNLCYGKDDAFYEGIGSYSLFHTCNTWANNALKVSKQKASLWTPFDTGIFYHYNQN